MRGPGYWLYMAPGTPHALVASEPSVMLLTLVTGGRGRSGGRMMVAVVGEERCRG